MARLFQPGDGLGGYRIARLVGAGGFAEVYEAVDATGVHRALKVLTAEASRGVETRAGLAREAEALVRIEHVNVVRIYEAGIEEDHVYLVLELVEGMTLGDKLGDPFALAPMEDVVRWIHQACEGVAAAHRVGVIHRDLKPANILVTPADVVKVIDFGIAKLKRWTSTANEQLLGTALYMAPEQLHVQPSDARADVYSMGVILYEALSGIHPLGFEREVPTVFQVFQQHLLGEPRPLREVAPEVPADLGALVEEALAKDPERRTPSMRALADGLYCVLRGMSRERRATVRRIASLGRDSAPDLSGPISLEEPSIRPEAPACDLSPMGRSAFPPPAPREASFPSSWPSISVGDNREAPALAPKDAGALSARLLGDVRELSALILGDTRELSPTSVRISPVPSARASEPRLGSVRSSHPFVPRGSSAAPVVAEAPRAWSWPPSRRRPGAASLRVAIPAFAFLLVLAAAVLWGAHARRAVAVPLPAAIPVLAADGAVDDGGDPGVTSSAYRTSPPRPPGSSP